MEPMDVLMSMWFETREWSKVPVILVNYKPLRDKLGLAADQKYFTYTQLATDQFREMMGRIEQKESGKQKVDLTHEEREAQIVADRLQILDAAVGAQSLAVVPHPSSAKGAWVPVTDIAKYYGAEKEAALQDIFKTLAGAYVARDPGAFAAASGQLRSFLISLSPSVYPTFASLQREVHYNSFHPFRKAWMFYLAAFVWMLATWRSRNAGVYWIGVALFLAGVAVHAWGFYLRIMIPGRPPITNMYESVVWVSFGAAFFALILELVYRPRYYVVAVAPLSIVMLLLADQFPAVLDPSIGPLVPVLRDNFWLSIHVPTITLGYAAFAVAMGVGHMAIGYYLFAPTARANHREDRELCLSRDADRGVAAGGGDDFGRDLGALCVGPVLGLGPEGDVGADRAGELFDPVARAAGGLAEQFRADGFERGVFHGRAHGVVRREFRARQGPAQLRIRGGRVFVCDRVCRRRVGAGRIRHVATEAPRTRSRSQARPVQSRSVVTETTSTSPLRSPHFAHDD